jgi:TPR repeat protein
LYTREGIPENFKEAVHWFMKAAHLGHIEAIFSYGQCLLLGIGIQKESQKAFFLFLWMATYGLLKEFCIVSFVVSLV